ncbi:MAG: T9SS type A sorting domain-containing protein [Bacteroidetes bacterium]|nr:T9SS type A sorting domain-containing protein [Bacteroidota bacterium]
MKSKLKFLLFWVLIALGSNRGLAQTITFSESFLTNETPPATYQGSTRVLYACAWQYAVLVNVSYTGTCSTFTQTLPAGMDFNIVTDAGVSVVSQNQNVVEYVMNASSGQITLQILDPCSLPLNFQPTPNSYVSPGCTVNPSTVSYIIKTPEVAFDNFVTVFDGVNYGSATPLQLYKRNDNTLIVRDYDIEINEGHLNQLDFEYTPDLELGTVTLEFSAGVNNLAPINTLGPTTVSLTGTSISTLFPGRTYLKIGDVIHVTETSFIDNCSATNSLDNTTYKLKSICTDYCSGAGCNCKVNEMNKAINVNSINNRLTIGHRINGQSSNNYQIDVCGIQSFDFEFRVTNPQVPLTNVANTGIKKLETVSLPMDLNAFDIAVGNTVETDRVLIRFNNVALSVDFLVNNNLVSPGFYTYNSATRVSTFDFSNLTNSAILTAWGGQSPFTNWYDPLEYNDFKEDTIFEVVFDDLLFIYDNYLTYGNPRVNLDECHGTGYAAMFSSTYGFNYFEYYNMCDVESQSLTTTYIIEYMNFGNYFPVTGFAEASDADIEIGSPVEVEFYFSGPTADSPWNLWYPASSGNSIRFNCPDNYYRAQISMPDNLLIDPGSFILYYTNPNNPGTAAQINVPTPVNLNGQNIYTFDLEDDLGNPIHSPNGLIEAIFIMAPCVSTTSGSSIIEMNIMNVCNANCDDNVVTVACFETELFWRCTGPCCGPPQSTSSFNFDRVTAGFTDNTLTTQVTLNSAVQKVNRSYACDHIAVSSEGQIFMLGDTCTVDSVTYSVIQVDEFYFRIAYTSPVAFQFYDYEDAYYTTTINGVTSAPINIPLADFSVVTLPGNEYHLKFKIASGAAALALQTTGYVVDVDFHATLKVKEMLTNPPVGYYLMPQIRGQFVGKISPAYEELSCDDWGDNMMVLNVLSSTSSQLVSGGYANEGAYGFSYSTGMCNRRFFLYTVVTGGLPGIDEFPNEFRPIALWPEQADPNQITMTLPPDIAPIVPFNPNAIRFGARNSSIGWTWAANAVPAAYQQVGQQLTFTGQGLTNNPWPVMEHNGNKVELVISGVLRSFCPPAGLDTPQVSFAIPHTKRAFAVDEPACQQVTNYVNNQNILNDELTVTMSYPQNIIDISSLTGTISGISVVYADIDGVATSIENFWIQNTSSGIVINSIQICPAVQNPVCTTATDVNGYFQLGNLTENQIYNLNINYTLTQCNTGTYFPLSLNYGFACSGYPPPAGNNCLNNQFQVNLNPLPSALSMNTTNNNVPADACGNYVYTFDLNSTSTGNVENIEFSATIPAGLSVVSATYVFNNLNGPLTVSNQVGQVTTWVLNNNIAGGVSLDQNDNLLITITLTGTCSSYGNSYQLNFIANSTDICSDQLPNSNSTYQSQLIFPAFNPQVNTCTDCFSCDSLALDVFMNDCEVTFEALIPANNFCASSTISWSFGDGTFDNTNTASVQHVYGNSGIYNACYTYTCFDSSEAVIDSCVVCETITVNCDPCSGAYMDVSIKDCSIEAAAFAPNMTGCANIMYAWGYGDGTFSPSYSLSNTTSHTYPGSGEYILCMGTFCYDANWNLLYGCKECDTIRVECKPDTFCLKINKEYDFDYGASIAMTADNGFAVAGTIFEKGSGGDQDMYFVKYRPDLTEEFYMHLGDFHDGDYTEEGYSVVVRSDGYYIAGTVIINTDNEDVFVVKINTDGTFAWGYRYGFKGTTIDFCRKMIDMETAPKDALLVVGGTNAVFGNSDILALKIDPATGAIIKQNAYYETESSIEFGNDVVATGFSNPKKEYAIVGSHTNDPGNLNNVVAVRIDTDLTLQIAGRIYTSDNKYEEAYGVERFQTKLYLTGYTRDSKGEYNLLIMGLDGSDLSQLIAVEYSADAKNMDEVGREIRLDDDRNLIVVGTTAETGGGTPTDGLILKVDPQNNLALVWTNGLTTNLPATGERILDVVQSNPDFYTVTGSYPGSATDDEDIFIARIGKDASSCCLVDYEVKDKTISFTEKELEKSKNPKLEAKAHGVSKDFYDVKYICPAESRIAVSPNVMQTQQGALLIMPNPNSGKFVMQLIDTEQNIKEVRVLDLSGRVIISKMISDADNGQMAIDASFCADGLYVVEVIGENSKWTAKVSIAK